MKDNRIESKYIENEIRLKTKKNNKINHIIHFQS
jgi:hypothetical protein